MLYDLSGLIETPFGRMGFECDEEDRIIIKDSYDRFIGAINFTDDETKDEMTARILSEIKSAESLDYIIHNIIGERAIITKDYRTAIDLLCEEGFKMDSILALSYDPISATNKAREVLIENEWCNIVGEYFVIIEEH